MASALENSKQAFLGSDSLVFMKPLIMYHWSSKQPFFDIMVDKPPKSLHDGNVWYTMAQVWDIAIFICSVKFIWECEYDIAFYHDYLTGMKRRHNESSDTTDKEHRLLNKIAYL